jgi:glycosyltransferase involved in cell wall biosynthesis
MPKISIVIPIYKTDASHIAQALASIVIGSTSDSEIHVGLDGDYHKEGLDILEKMQAKSKKCKIRISQFNRQGLVETLNALIEKSDCDYIARHDGDDICLPDRLDLQTSAMEQNPSASFCGTQITRCDVHMNPHRLQRKLPSTFKGQLQYASLFNNPIAHPTLLIKRQAIEDTRYNNVNGAEDWDLYIRLWMEGHRSFNLNQTGLLYRIHPNQITQRNRNSGLLNELKQRSLEACIHTNNGGSLLRLGSYISENINLSERAIKATRWLQR